MKLILKCKDCGTRTVVQTKTPIMCKKCKNTQWYCFECKTYFEPEEMCSRCRWFICPECGSCGCDFYRRRRAPSRVSKHSMMVTKGFEEPPPIYPLFMD